MFSSISFKRRQSFFDIEEFLKHVLHFMDLGFQVVVKEVLLITMLNMKTVKTVKGLFTIHFHSTFFSVNNDNINNSDNDINNNNKLLLKWLSAWVI